MASVYIGLGTNIEPRLERIEHAMRELDALSPVLSKSAIYETAPVGFTDQAFFLNAVALIKWKGEPEELLDELREIETELGRQARERWHEREIDLDILLFGNEIVNFPHLRIPHPELHNRKFVLEPLAEIAADLVHPVLGKTIKQLNEELKDSDQSVVRV